jgi:hypothetical protein
VAVVTYVAQASVPTPATAFVTEISQSSFSRSSGINFGERPAAIRRHSREHQIRRRPLADGGGNGWPHAGQSKRLTGVGIGVARPEAVDAADGG